MPRAVVDMTTNVPPSEYRPRLVMALATALGAALAPTLVLKGLLTGATGGILLTVATGYCPLNAAIRDGRPVDVPKWRTLRSHKVEA